MGIKLVRNIPFVVSELLRMAPRNVMLKKKFIKMEKLIDFDYSNKQRHSKCTDSEEAVKKTDLSAERES